MEFGVMPYVMHFIPPFVEDELYQNMGSKNKKKVVLFSIIHIMGKKNFGSICRKWRRKA